MKKITLQLTQFDFQYLKNLILLLEEKHKKKQKRFSGTKLIEYDFILIPMLKDRYLFRYTAEKLIGIPKRIFTVELYQAAALYYFLQDTDGLPITMLMLRTELRNELSDYLYTTEKSEFQIFYEENLFDEWQLSYTELRDEHHELYYDLRARYESRKLQSLGSMGI